MSNEFDVVGTPNSTPEDTVLSDIRLASTEYGPKRVKTPNIEVEQFDPNVIQRAREREQAINPTIESLVTSIGTPSDIFGGCNHNHRRKSCGY